LRYDLPDRFRRLLQVRNCPVGIVLSNVIYGSEVERLIGGPFSSLKLDRLIEQRFSDFWLKNIFVFDRIHTKNIDA
jgi:hypothetical protein